MRKFQVLVLAVALVFASVTLAQAQVIGGGGSAAANSSVNYVHNDFTAFGLGGLDLVGAAAGVSMPILGAGLGGLAGAAIGGLGVTAIDTILGAATSLVNPLVPLTSIALLPISLPMGIAGAALGAVAGSFINSHLYALGGAASLTAIISGVGGLVGSAADILLGTLGLGTLAGAGLGLVAGGIEEALVGIGAAVGGILLPSWPIGAIGGALAGFDIGANLLSGLLWAGIGAAAGALIGPFGPFGIGAAVIGGGLGLIGGGLTGLAVGLPMGIAGIGLGNTMDEVIQAGLTRGDNAPAKPAASVADFM